VRIILEHNKRQNRVLIFCFVCVLAVLIMKILTWRRDQYVTRAKKKEGKIKEVRHD
jgi:hypothetical protein